jgi:hypothetical protein
MMFDGISLTWETRAQRSGTTATRFHIAGFAMREIAERLAREEASVEKIIQRSVARTAATRGAHQEAGKQEMNNPANR